MVGGEEMGNRINSMCCELYILVLFLSPLSFIVFTLRQDPDGTLYVFRYVQYRCIRIVSSIWMNEKIAPGRSVQLKKDYP